MAEEKNDLFTDTLRNGELYTSLEVVKNTKGYNWTVKITGFDVNRVKETLVETEKFCKETYGSE